MIIVGELSLWIALLMSVWCATLAFAGARFRREDLVISGERAADATCVFSALAMIGVLQALLSRDFSYAYVTAHITANMPDAYVVAALWSGAGGSILLWIVWIALATVVARYSMRASSLRTPLVTGTLGLILTFLIATVAFEANPFTRLDVVPIDGEGMNPQLQNPAMLLHPPLLTLGFAFSAIPFAQALAALLSESLRADALAIMRRWMLAVWLGLGSGLLTGMWWAYIEPGWGGYWSWDPVQAAALLPWLACTAFLHAAMRHERRGGSPRWLLTLAMLPFLLAVFAAFVARGVLMDTLHSFAQSAAGTWFSAFLMLASVTTAYLVTTRFARAQAARVPPLLSRDAAMLYNNVVLLGIAFSVFWGLLFPLISMWMRETRISLGAPFFNAVNGPFVPVVFALMGLAQLLPWSAPATTLRRRLRWPLLAMAVVVVALWVAGLRDTYALIAGASIGFVLASIAVAVASRRTLAVGGYLAHAGIALLVVGVTGNGFARTHDVSLTAGETYAATDPFGRQWRFASQGISTSQYHNSDVTTLALEVFRDGRSIGFVSSERRAYFDTQGRPVFDPSTESGILSDARGDVYVVLSAVTDDVAEVRISFNPLVIWVWIGGVVVLLGGFLVMGTGSGQDVKGPSTAAGVASS